MKQKELIESSNITAKLIRSTVQQFGGWESFQESAQDVSTHGIDGGYGAFIYYSDTVPFFKRNKKEIMELANDQAEEFGQGTLEMINGFGCMESLDLTIDELARAIYSGKGDLTTNIFNCLAWYAGEEVCRSYCDLIED